MVMDFLLSQTKHKNMSFKLRTCKANMCISVFKIKIKHMSTRSLNHQIKFRLHYLFKVSCIGNISNKMRISYFEQNP